MKIVTCASVLALTTAAAAHAASEDLDSNGDMEELVVVAYPAIIDNSAAPVEAPPAMDGGDFLRQITGVSAGRFGGHSLEPVVRGLSQGQLTIMHDGTFQVGSGPNRMDTPSTYATIDLIDRVTVHRGYQSVLNGPGAVGGTILFERDIPEFEKGFWSKAKAGTAYETNGNASRGFLRASAGRDSLAVEGWGSFHNAGNYSDGGSKVVRSGFNDYAAGGALTLMGQSGAYLQVTYSWNRMEDSLFPGAGMDSVLTGGETIGLKGTLPLQGSVVHELRMKASYASTLHVMNNHALRMNMGMLAEARTRSKASNAGLEADISLAGAPATLAADYRHIRNNGARYGGMMPGMLNQSTTILWPDIETTQVGLAFEQRRQAGDALEVIYGLRSDWTDVSFARAGEAADMGLMGMMPPMPAMSPNMLYGMFYGITAADVSEHIFSGLLRAEWQVNQRTTLHAGVSKSGRTADATERGMANLMMMGGTNSSWVGNPALLPEKHYQAEIGFLRRGSNWSGGVTAFINRVDDFILRDSARGQEGILPMLPMADVYRNVDALLMGFESQLSWQLSNALQIDAGVAWNRGKDIGRDAPLAQIPPLQGSLAARYGKSAWQVTASMRFALRQGRVDTNPMMGTGRDSRATPGYAVFDLAALYRLKEGLNLQFGARNLFDELYADHLNRSNLLDATEVQVNEPGRSLYAKLVASF